MSDQSQSRIMKVGRGAMKGVVAALFILPLIGNLAGYSSQIYTASIISIALGITWFAHRWEQLEVNNAL